MKELKNLKIKRSFGLSNLALKNQISVFILTFILSLGGIYSYIKMPKESFPEIVIPTIYIGVPYPGNSPADMENLVTRPIEKELQSLSGIKNISSTSFQDFSSIVVEFNPDIDIPKALQDVKDAVDKSKSDLPKDLPEDPNVMEINFSDFPIMTLNVSGDYENQKLKEYAEYLEEEIEKLPEISKVDITGALEREISIIADLYRMEAAKVSFQDIENAVRAENVSMSAGEVLNQGFKRSLRITSEFKSADEIKDIIVKQEKGNTIYLHEVARVVDGFEERESFARANNLPVISIQVVKRSGENLLAAAKKINEIIVDAKENVFPEDLTVTITNDNSRYTKNQVYNLENSIVTGVILVTLTLLFFMGLRNSLFVGIAIPLSMFIAFLTLSSTGVTLNLIVLFSLILALGLLVDNGIVVVENIYRLMQEGYTPFQAAKEGVGEVAMPIISSTATTLIAFVPLIFWEDIIGEFMKFLPVTLIIVLASSLFVALVINPVLTASFMKVEEPDNAGKKRKYLWISLIIASLAVVFYVAGAVNSSEGLRFFGGIIFVFALITFSNVYILTPSAAYFQNKLLPRIENFYESSVRFALRKKNPYYYFFGSVFLLIFSVMLLGVSAPKVLLFPQNEPNNIYVFAEAPIGSDVSYTDSITRIIEKRVFETLEPSMQAVESVIANVGKGVNNPNEDFSDNAKPNKSRVAIAFVEYEKRGDVSTSKVLENLREALDDIPGINITVEKERMGPPVGKPVNIEISGEKFDTLIYFAENIKNKIESSEIQGIEGLQMDLETQKPQMLLSINRDAATRFGLSTYSIGTALRTALFGKDISKFKEGEDEFDIRLRLEDEDRYNITNLLNQRITFRDQSTGKIQQVPISAVTDVTYGTTYGSVKRKDLDRVITLYSNVEEGFNGNEIVTKLKRLLNDYELPAGYEFKFTGEQEEQAKSSDFLFRAMMIAVFGIFLILVSQFNSLIKPFIIIGSVIFSTIGVFLGLVIFRMDFVIIMTGIGIISLAGIVVNNAIVLIDYTDLVRERKKKEQKLKKDQRLPHKDFIEAVVEGGKTRLRPVLLTAITTVLGLVPLAIGLNINFFTLLTDFDPQIYLGGDNALFWGPMAWTVVFGLSFATFLTLIVVPVMYVLADKLSHYAEDKFGDKNVSAGDTQQS